MSTQMKLKRKYTLGRPYVPLDVRGTVKDYPKELDAKAPSHPSKGRTGNSHGQVSKKNKGGKRSECHHGVTGHGPCACRN